MKGDVRIRVFVEPRAPIIAGAIAAAELVHEAPQFGDIGIGGALGGEPRCHAFERGHDRDDLDDFALGLFDDIDAAPRPGADKALLFEQCHRFADRRPADP